MGNHFPLEGGTQGGSLHTQTFKEVTLKQFQKQNFQSALKGRDIIAMGAALRQEIQPTTLVVGFMRQQKLINRFNGLKPLKRFIKFHRYLFPRINPWAKNAAQTGLAICSQHTPTLLRNVTPLKRGIGSSANAIRMHSNQAIRVTGRSPNGAEYVSDGRSPSAEERDFLSHEVAEYKLCRSKACHWGSKFIKKDPKWKNRFPPSRE